MIKNGQTCLEAIGIKMRNKTLRENYWQKNYDYDKKKVDDELTFNTSLYVGQY